MMRGVIQVTCHLPARGPAQALITPSKSRSKVTVYCAWRISRRTLLADMEFVEKQHATLGKRVPFQRTEMGEW